MAAIPATSLLFLLLLLADVITAVVTCPAPCRCAGTHVTCHSHLTHVPEDVPAQTTWLDLSHNNLTSLDRRTLSNLVHLMRLNVYGNNISTIADDTFTNLTNLQSVNLGYNRLSYLNPDVFAVLPNLRSVYLSGNPWSCDCHLQHLITWVRASAAVQSGRWGPTCASPSQLRHTPLDQVDPQTLCPNTTSVDSKDRTDKVLTRTTTQLTTISNEERLSAMTRPMTYKIPYTATTLPTAPTIAECGEAVTLTNITVSDMTVQWQVSSPDVTSLRVTYQVPHDVVSHQTRVLHRHLNSFTLTGLTQNTSYIICVRSTYRRRQCRPTNATCVQVRTASPPDLDTRSVHLHGPGKHTVAGVLAAVVAVASVILIASCLRQKISSLIHSTCQPQTDNMQMGILPYS
ncbi:uncharacterized protein LOC144928104 isoform X2 [Branchiostoma floridae x Branchiostoma belcheri]